MKNFILSLGILFLIPLSQAETSAVIAEYTFTGAIMASPRAPFKIQYQILENGTQQVVTWYHEEKPYDTRVLKQMEESELAFFKGLVSSVQPGPLFDPYPGVIGCLEGPSYVYRVFQNTQEIPIAQTLKCKDHGRENTTAADAQIVEKLNEVEKLANETP